MSIDRHTRYPYTTDTNLWFLNLVDIDDRSAVAVTAVFLRGSARRARLVRSEEHTSELQSRFRISYAVFFFNDTATTEIYTLSLHDALPIYLVDIDDRSAVAVTAVFLRGSARRARLV